MCLNIKNCKCFVSKERNEYVSGTLSYGSRLRDTASDYLNKKTKQVKGGECVLLDIKIHGYLFNKSE